MNKLKNRRNIYIYIAVGIVIGFGSLVYAVGSVIESKSVLYNRTISGGSSDNVQGSIDELYKMSGVSTTLYKEEILNGADPVLGKDMIPVTLDGDGTVKYANLNTPWYKYAEKRWANAVILVGNPSKNYKTGDIILEKDIESYFVWVPRFKYKIWNDGNYTAAYTLSELKDTAESAPTDITSLRNITGNARIIDVIFEDNTVQPSTGTAIGSYHTHPAFLTFNVNGLWVGKFEIGYNQMEKADMPIDSTNWITAGAEKDAVESNRIIIKPNVYAWTKATAGTMFKSSFNYNRTLDSHMIKNTEWGAAAYLSHSVYGIGNEVNMSNSKDRMTGRSSKPNTDKTSASGENGSALEKTFPYNTPTGYLASTTGNITGIYDMSGGTGDFVAAYMDGYGVTSSLGRSSGLLASDLSTYDKYFDKYSNKCSDTSYNMRILGDATGELGPFYYYREQNRTLYYHNSWYADYAKFIDSEYPWFVRGEPWDCGVLDGQMAFAAVDGTINLGGFVGFRLVLAVK